MDRYIVNKMNYLKYNNLYGSGKKHITIITKEMELLEKNADGLYVLDRLHNVDHTDIDGLNNLIKPLEQLNNLVFLDFHGVVDLFDKDARIPYKGRINMCCISYIGGKNETIGGFVNDILPRIKSGEMMFAVIVYTKKKNPIIGTKAWFLSLISQIIKDQCIINFIDDSLVNINCVQKLNLPNIISHFIDNTQSDDVKKQSIISILES